jgi:hypothetical protein
MFAGSDVGTTCVWWCEFVSGLGSSKKLVDSTKKNVSRMAPADFEFVIDLNCPKISKEN